jgi:hypothetical protein
VTRLYPILLVFAAAAATGPSGTITLDSVRADPNPEHRAKAAVDFAVTAERDAEIANGYTDAARFKTDIDNMVAAMELARDSFTAAGRTPGRQPGSFKSVELLSHNMLHRLADLRDKLDEDQRSLLDGPIMKIQEIHDAWFDGIMGKKK